MLVMTEAFDPQFGEAWNRRQVEDALRIGNCHYLLSEVEGDCSGFALSRHAFDEEELLLFAVRPKYRLRGIGRDLLGSFIESASRRKVNRVFLEMRKGNPASRLYESSGFTIVGQRRDYYRMFTGERIDAVTYAREIRGDF
ncbi:GNAT family N-acetyltransferase [Novosphingobium sp. PC22D]|uniref:GNAT family N-acetyltransferase n=1 Tax=Novosphingobium sp. PC22D TaxID=1962403 RepID=UPI000BF05ACD|nr:GNAT family N-acetyltransferase [Novosphingobium sp. PC22D]